MSLTDPFELDPTSPASNSNFAGAVVSEGCAPSGINNAIRALGSMLAKATSYQSPAISASVSTNIAAAGTGYYMAITGANAINSFGVVPGAQPGASPFRVLGFSSSASLSHGTHLILLGAASRKTQPGDVGVYIHEGSSDVWREILFNRADGSLPVSVGTTSIANDAVTYAKIQNVSAASRLLGRGSAAGSGDAEEITPSTGLTLSGTTLTVETPAFAYGEYASYDSTTTVMANDNSIPQNTEGKQAITVTFTPKRSTSKVRITGTAFLTHSSAGEPCVMAVFQDTTANALRANQGSTSKQTSPQSVVVDFVVDASSTSARDYKLRWGPGTAGTCYINGDNSAREFGGVAAATLFVQEIFA